MALVTPTEPVPFAELGRVHFVGIGGAGMSAIARIMLARGVQVSGSDNAASAAVAELQALGATVFAGHRAEQVEGVDTLVISSAIRPGNPELVAARERGLAIVHRAAALASLMEGRRVIAVTGTHGKTTTTSMIATLLLETGNDPAYAIGGVLAATGTGAADGDGRDFVAEADESDGSFLMYAPDIAIVTNIEADHLDNYGTPQAYRASFARFIDRVKPGGLLVTSADDAGARDLAAVARSRGLRVVTFGESASAGYRIEKVRASGMETSFLIRNDPPSTTSASADPGGGADGNGGTGGRELTGRGSDPGPFGKIIDLELHLRVPGHHNAANAAAAFAAAVEAGVDPEAAATALASYRGAARRLEPKGEAGGVRVLDTYAHHPTELAADLRAAREIVTPPGRVIAVFQPHLYSRTRIFAAEFGAALALADEVVVLDVYAAREDPEPGVTGELVAAAVPGSAVPGFAAPGSAAPESAVPGSVVPESAASGSAAPESAVPGAAAPGSAAPESTGPGFTGPESTGRVRYVPAFGDVPGVVAAIARPSDLVLTMGAGDITTMGPLILAEIAAIAARAAAPADSASASSASPTSPAAVDAAGADAAGAAADVAGAGAGAAGRA